MVPVASQHSFDGTQFFAVSHKIFPGLTPPASLFPTTLPLAYTLQPGWHSSLTHYSFHSSGHFPCMFPLPGIRCPQTSVWVASHHSGLSPNVTSSEKSSGDPGRWQIQSDPSCHTLIHTAQFLCFHRCFDSLKLLVYYVYYLHCLLVTFTCL